jgi:hypothetical protein
MRQAGNDEVFPFQSSGRAASPIGSRSIWIAATTAYTETDKTIAAIPIRAAEIKIFL